MGKKVVHVEFPAQDVNRAEKFGEGVGGWSIENAGMPGIDTEGNAFSLFQSDQSVPMPEGAGSAG